MKDNQRKAMFARDRAIRFSKKGSAVGSVSDEEQIFAFISKSGKESFILENFRKKVKELKKGKEGNTLTFEIGGDKKIRLEKEFETPKDEIDLVKKFGFGLHKRPVLRVSKIDEKGNIEVLNRIIPIGKFIRDKRLSSFHAKKTREEKK